MRALLKRTRAIFLACGSFCRRRLARFLMMGWLVLSSRTTLGVSSIGWFMAFMIRRMLEDIIASEARARMGCLMRRLPSLISVALSAPMTDCIQVERSLNSDSESLGSEFSFGRSFNSMEL